VWRRVSISAAYLRGPVPRGLKRPEGRACLKADVVRWTLVFLWAFGSRAEDRNSEDLAKERERSMCLGRGYLWLILAPVVASALAGLGCGEVQQDAATQAPQTAKEHVLPPARLKDIEKALQAKRGAIFCRALQESALHINESPMLAAAILHKFPRYDGAYSESFALVALGNARGQVAQEVICSYKDADTDKRRFLRIVFGRMGPAAHAAVPMLRDELGTAEVGPEDQMAIKVVLASIGQASPAEMDQIAQSIAAGDRLGRAAMLAMAGFGRNDWVSAKVRMAMVKAMENLRANQGGFPTSDTGVVAAWALGTLGDKADGRVRNALAEAVESVRGRARFVAEYSVGFLSLARVDPERRRNALLEGFSSEPALFSFYGGMSAVLLEGICAGITDDAFIGDVESLLCSPSAQVSVQAANVLRVIGPGAQRAVPQLLRLVESASAKEVRIAAAEALGMIADPSCASALSDLGRKSDGEMRRTIEESVRAISLAE